MECPHCGAEVPEGPELCPKCFKPLKESKEEPTIAGGGIPGLYTADQQSAAGTGQSESQPTASSQYRVSLTGEVIDLAPSPPKTGPSGSGPLSPPSPSPIPPLRSAPTTRGAEVSRSRIVSTRHESSQRKSSLPWLIILILILAAGGAAGLWIYTRPDPKQVVNEVVKAEKAKDWVTMYGLMSPDSTIVSKYPDQASFVQYMNQMTGRVPDTIYQQLVKGIKVSEPTYSNGEASVRVVQSLPLFGRTIKIPQTITLKRVYFQWKISNITMDMSRLKSLNSIGP